MILPAPRASMSLPTSLASTNGAERFVSSTWSQSASLCSAAGARRMVPALLTSTSTVSTSSRSRPTNSRQAARSAKSHRNPRNVRPAARTARSTSLPSASSDALTPTTSAPASASATAMLRPMPRRHPVTSAVFPSRRKRSSTGTAEGYTTSGLLTPSLEPAALDEPASSTPKGWLEVGRWCQPPESPSKPRVPEERSI